MVGQLLGVRSEEVARDQGDTGKKAGRQRRLVDEERAEVVAVDTRHGDWSGSGHGGRTRFAVYERELAEVLIRHNEPLGTGGGLDERGATQHDDERIARLSLPHDGLVVAVALHAREFCDALAVPPWQSLEQRRSLQCLQVAGCHLAHRPSLRDRRRSRRSGSR